MSNTDECASCNLPFKDGDEVTLLMEGVIVGGKFQQSEEESIVHADGECGMCEICGTATGQHTEEECYK